MAPSTRLDSSPKAVTAHQGDPPLATPRPLLGHRDGRRQGGWLGLCRQLWEWDSSHTLPVAARTQSGMPFKARATLCSASKMA